MMSRKSEFIRVFPHYHWSSRLTATSIQCALPGVRFSQKVPGHAFAASSGVRLIREVMFLRLFTLPILSLNQWLRLYGLYLHGYSRLKVLTLNSKIGIPIWKICDPNLRD